MLTIKNIDKIINITSPLPYKWYISAVDELPDDLYGFSVYINGKIENIFYLNRECGYMRMQNNEPVYRLYKNFDQSKINRWLSLHQISPYFIKQAIDKMLNE
jgi:hypothetical protein